MAIRLVLSTYARVQADPLSRTSVGWFPRITEQEAWTAARGVRKINRDRAGRQRFAIVVGNGRVCAVAELTGMTPIGDRYALEGQVLAAGHPIREAYLGQVDPAPGDGQHPVTYCELPEEQQFRAQCGCGCGEASDRDYLPGHDVRALQARVRDYFHGSVKEMLDWVDTHVSPGRITVQTHENTDHSEAAPAPMDESDTSDPHQPDDPDPSEVRAAPAVTGAVVSASGLTERFPHDSPAIVQAVHHVVVVLWTMTDVRWTAVRDAAREAGLTLNTRHQVHAAVTEALGDGIEIQQSADRTWAYPVTHLFVRLGTWLAKHAVPPLAFYRQYTLIAPCVDALPAALALRDQCDLVNGRRLLADLRRAGVALPTRSGGQQRLADLVRYHHDSMADWS